MIYNIHNFVSVEVDDHSQIFSAFNVRLHKFASTTKCRRNIVFRQAEGFYRKDTCIIGEFGEYAFDGSHLYLKLGRGYIKLDKNLAESDQIVEYEKGAEPEKVFGILALLLRRNLLKEGCSLTHASGASKDGKAYIFVAWAHTGKTNILLHMLRNGYEYLSDDRIILSRDGYAYPYTLTLNLFDYNLRVHPWLKEKLVGNNISRKIKFSSKAWVKNRLESIVRNYSLHSQILDFLVLKGYQFLNSSLFPAIDPESIDVHLELSKKTIDALFVLSRLQGSNDIKIVEVEDLEEEYRKIISVNDSEDGFKTTNLQFVHSFAFPSLEDEADELAILTNALKSKRLFRLYLPENGATKETCEKVYNYISNNLS